MFCLCLNVILVVVVLPTWCEGLIVHLRAGETRTECWASHLMRNWWIGIVKMIPTVEGGLHSSAVCYNAVIMQSCASSSTDALRLMTDDFSIFELGLTASHCFSDVSPTAAATSRDLDIWNNARWNAVIMRVSGGRGGGGVMKGGGRGL